MLIKLRFRNSLDVYFKLFRGIRLFLGSNGDRFDLFELTFILWIKINDCFFLLNLFGYGALLFFTGKGVLFFRGFIWFFFFFRLELFFGLIFVRDFNFCWVTGRRGLGRGLFSFFLFLFLLNFFWILRVFLIIISFWFSVFLFFLLFFLLWIQFGAAIFFLFLFAAILFHLSLLLFRGLFYFDYFDFVTLLIPVVWFFNIQFLKSFLFFRQLWGNYYLLFFYLAYLLFLLSINL